MISSLAVSGLLYLLLGAVAGLIAGLFGLGGGVVIVPALMFAFALQGLPDTLAIHMAIATSLATIMVTSLGAMYEFQQQRVIVWPTVRVIAIGLLLGAVIGVHITLQLDGVMLKRVFAGFLLLIAAQLLFRERVFKGKTPGEAVVPTAAPGIAKLLLGGGAIGTVSTMLGIGGGVMSVPFFQRYYSMRQAIAMAGVGGFVLAIGGVVSNVALGLEVSGRPPWSLGYIYLPAFAGIVLSSIVCARLGAKLAGRLPERRLQQAFAGVLVLVALRLLWV